MHMFAPLFFDLAKNENIEFYIVHINFPLNLADAKISNSEDFMKDTTTGHGIFATLNRGIHL